VEQHITSSDDSIRDKSDYQHDDDGKYKKNYPETSLNLSDRKLETSTLSFLCSSLIQFYIEGILPLQYIAQGGYTKLYDRTHLSDPCT